MKPEQFIRWFGIEDAKYLIEQNINCNDFEFSLEDLKDLATSVEIVELFESIEGAKDAHKNGLGFHSVLIGGYEIPIARLGDAIKDHESIYGGE